MLTGKPQLQPLAPPKASQYIVLRMVLSRAYRGCRERVEDNKQETHLTRCAIKFPAELQ